MPRPLVLCCAAALIGIVVLVYHESPGNVFHFDDEDNILDAPAIHMQELSTHALARAVRDAHLPRRPIPNLTLAVDWWRGSGDPRPFQWTNLAIHCLVALLVFSFLTLALSYHRPHGPRSRLVVAAFAAALLWAIHPIHVQAVTYIVQRMASLAALFMLSSMVCYVRGRQCAHGARRWLWWAAGAAAAFCAVLSKENAVIIPMLILLVEFGLVRNHGALVNRRWDILLLCLPLLVVAFVAADLATGVGPLSRYVLPGYENRAFTLSQRLLTQPRVIFFHLYQILWPLPEHFSIEHAFPVSTGWFAPASTVLALAAAAAWIALGVWLVFRKGARVWGALLLWVPGTLVVESSIIPLEMVFEHRMYFPSIGLAGLLSLVLHAVLDRGTPPRMLVGVAVVVVAMTLARSSMIRIPLWSSRLALYTDAVAHAPQSSRAWGNLGLYYLESGDARRALPALRKSLDLNPGDPRVVETLAALFIDEGRFDEAEELLRHTYRQTGRTPSLLNHFGELALKRREYSMAQSYFADAIALAGWNPVYHWNLALSYEQAGDCERALQIWRRYLEIEPAVADRRAVDEHLRKQYHDPRGACFRDGN